MDEATNGSCFDTSGHQVIVVGVEPGVQLEVLDWGGTGETMVLLTGLGDNAHVVYIVVEALVVREMREFLLEN